MSYPEKHIAIVCNPTDENEKALRMTERLTVLLQGMDIRHTAFTAQWPETLDGFTEAWIVGGDGTLNWFINCYPIIDIPMSVFAGGSGNDFHWMLYGEMKMEAQVDLILEAQPKRVDAGICNRQLFLNGVGIGFDGAIVKDLWGKKKVAGKASYLLSVLKNLVGYREKSCSIEAGTEQYTQDCLMVSVANARRYGGGFNVAPKASVTDGLLDLNVVGAVSPVSRMRFLPVIERGEHIGHPFIRYSQEKSVIIRSDVKMHCHIDGEYVFEDSYEIQVSPKHFSFLY